MTKEQIPMLLQPWFEHEFEDWGGTTGPDYFAFERAFGRHLNKDLGFKARMHPNHYEFCAVITKKGDDGKDHYAYVAISDVRHFPGKWYASILVRSMAHPEDWTGGSNTYCRIDQLKEYIDRALEEKA